MLTEPHFTSGLLKRSEQRSLSGYCQCDLDARLALDGQSHEKSPGGFLQVPSAHTIPTRTPLTGD